MMRSWSEQARRSLAALRLDRSGSSAVEFAIVCTPLVFTLLAVLQVGIYYMTQAALDSGVNAQADALNTTFLSQSTPTAPTAAALQSAIASKAGGLVSASTVVADLQPFSNLTSAPVAIGSNAPNIGSAGTCSSQSSCGGTILALRAQAPVVSFAPFFGTGLKVRSAVLVRRQAQ